MLCGILRCTINHQIVCLIEIDISTYLLVCVQLAGNIAISASYDSTVRLWNVKTGKSLHTMRGHASAIWGLDTLGGKVVSSSTDTYIRRKAPPICPQSAIANATL